MAFWMALWKAVLVLGVALFAGMSVWVIVAGYRDIFRMLRRIDSEHRGDAPGPSMEGDG